MHYKSKPLHNNINFQVMNILINKLYVTEVTLRKLMRYKNT